mmetsp:Transcript_16709/g.27098  ORF Transcript_16709/g.27098 Transcript_16709/m.27098 type:complete len:87 (-) Transcript_16709:774-1034(-)
MWAPGVVYHKRETWGADSLASYVSPAPLLTQCWISSSFEGLGGCGRSIISQASVPCDDDRVGDDTGETNIVDFGGLRGLPLVFDPL